MASLYLGLENIHVFLDADFGEGMEIIPVVNKLLAHSLSPYANARLVIALVKVLFMPIRR